MNLLSNLLLLAVLVGLLARLVYIVRNTESHADMLARRQRDALAFIQTNQNLAPEFCREIDGLSMLNPIPWQNEVKRRLANSDVPADFRAGLTAHFYSLSQASA